MVNPNTDHRAEDPYVEALTNGGFVVVWRDRSASLGLYTGLHAQLFGATGNKVGSQFLVNSIDSIVPVRPVISSLNNGDFVVAWTGIDNNASPATVSDMQIRTQALSISGVKINSERIVNIDSEGFKLNPSIAKLSTGGYVIAWGDGGDNTTVGTPLDVRAQIFDASHAKAGAEFTINTNLVGEQKDSSVTGLIDGGFVASWWEAGGTDVKAQIFTDAGLKTGVEFLVNTTYQAWQILPQAATLSNGNFIVVWVDTNNQDAADDYIRGQIFAADGTKVGVEQTFSTLAAKMKRDVRVAPLLAGGFIVSWVEYSGSLADAATMETHKARIYS